MSTVKVENEDVLYKDLWSANVHHTKMIQNTSTMFDERHKFCCGCMQNMSLYTHTKFQCQSCSHWWCIACLKFYSLSLSEERENKVLVSCMCARQ